MRFSAVFALAICPVFAFAQADWRFVQPDATLIGSFKVQPLLNSPLLAAAMAEGQKGQPGQNEAQVAMAMAMVKGLLGGIEEVRFSVMDNGTPQPDAVALVTGTLDDAMIGMLSQGKASVKRMDANTVLIGTPSALEAAVRRMAQTTAALQPRALAGVETLAPYDIWVSGKLPDLPPGLPLAPGLNLNLKGLALGLSLHENLEAQLTMEAANAKQAESLVKTAHEAESTQPTQYRGLLQSFVEGNTAHFRMNIPKDLVLDAIRTQGKGIQPLAAGNAAPNPLVIEPPQRRSIVIEGLDSGTKEIPLK